MDEDDIGIFDVEAFVWFEEQKRARELLDQGLCPRHNLELIETGTEEVCPECEQEDE